MASPSSLAEAPNVPTSVSADRGAPTEGRRPSAAPVDRGASSTAVASAGVRRVLFAALLVVMIWWVLGMPRGRDRRRGRDALLEETHDRDAVPQGSTHHHRSDAADSQIVVVVVNVVPNQNDSKRYGSTTKKVGGLESEVEEVNGEVRQGTGGQRAAVDMGGSVRPTALPSSGDDDNDGGGGPRRRPPSTHGNDVNAASSSTLQPPGPSRRNRADERSNPRRALVHSPQSCSSVDDFENVTDGRGFDLWRDGFPLATLRINPSNASVRFPPLWLPEDEVLVVRTEPYNATSVVPTWTAKANSSEHSTARKMLRESPFFSPMVSNDTANRHHHRLAPSLRPRIAFAPLAELYQAVDLSWNRCFTQWWRPTATIDAAPRRAGASSLSKDTTAGAEEDGDDDEELGGTSTLPPSFMFLGDSHLRDLYSAFCVGVVQRLNSLPLGGDTTPFFANDKHCRVRWKAKMPTSYLVAFRGGGGVGNTQSLADADLPSAALPPPSAAPHPPFSSTWPFMMYAIAGSAGQRHQHLTAWSDAVVAERLRVEGGGRRRPRPAERGGHGQQGFALPELVLVASLGTADMTHNNTDPNEVVSGGVNWVLLAVREALTILTFTAQRRTQQQQERPVGQSQPPLAANNSENPAKHPPITASQPPRGRLTSHWKWSHLVLRVRVVMYAMHAYHRPLGTENRSEMKCASRERQSMYRSVSYCIASELNRLFSTSSESERSGGSTGADSPRVELSATVFDVWSLTATQQARVNSDGHHYSFHVLDNIATALAMHLCLALPSPQSTASSSTSSAAHEGGSRDATGGGPPRVRPFLATQRPADISSSSSSAAATPNRRDATGNNNHAGSIGDTVRQRSTTAPTVGLGGPATFLFVSREMEKDSRYNASLWECRCFALPNIPPMSPCALHIWKVHNMTHVDWPGGSSRANTTHCLAVEC